MSEQKNPISEGMSFDELAAKIKELRQEEVERAALRAEYEAVLIAGHFTGKGEGTETKKTDAFKVQITYNVDHKIISVEALGKAVPSDIFGEITKTKIEFSKSGYNNAVKRLEVEATSDPEAKKTLTKVLKAFDTCIERKANKPTVKVELLSAK